MNYRRTSYHHILFQDCKVFLPCLDDIFMELHTIRYLCILEVLMKKKEQLAEFFAFNDVKRLNSVFRMSSQ